MALEGTSNEQKIWNYLEAKGLTAHGIAGLMGNLYAESALNPKNLQNTSEKKLDMSDAEYVQAVDAGTYDNFVKDGAGFGLAQWTFWSRKQNLHNFAKSAGKSIGDLEMQLDFLGKELSEGYKSVLETLKNAGTVLEASNAVLLQYERPANQGKAVQTTRANYGQKYYDKYAEVKKAEGGNSNMTEAQVRQKIVGIMQGWVGRKEADGTHRVIVDTYNGHKPLARNYKVTYTDPWCATTTSAAAIAASYEEIIPLECSCGNLIELAKKMGIWQESDSYVPEPADLVLYDWSDKANFATTDNTGWPDHVGMVEKIVGSTITVIEGNISDAVGRRNLQVNGRYIRGYITPKYETLATGEEEENASGEIKVGDIVEFTGNKHYTSSYSGAKKRTCRPGKARVTAVSKGKAHEYHLVAISGGGSNVYGWTDASDIKGSTAQTSGEIKVGDIVNFSGNIHYTSSYKGAKGVACKGGKAQVTRINKNGAHPYHLKNVKGGGSTVHGWVDAGKVSK